MKHTGACKSEHKRSYPTIIMVHARTMLLYQNSIRNTEASNHYKLNIELSCHKYQIGDSTTNIELGSVKR